MDITINTIPITRLEVIDETGRVYTCRPIKNMELSVQDSGRTLKVFVEKAKRDYRD